jgi:hypothetical protein
MMDQFVKVYWPGGMSLSYSRWVLIENHRNGWQQLHKTLEVVK